MSDDILSLLKEWVEEVGKIAGNPAVHHLGPLWIASERAIQREEAQAERTKP